jgi:hypothetical protein
MQRIFCRPRGSSLRIGNLIRRVRTFESARGKNFFHLLTTFSEDVLPSLAGSDAYRLPFILDVQLHAQNQQ